MADISLKPNWSELPNELLQSILEKIKDDMAILRFKAVCSSWQVAANSYVTSPFYSPFSHSPWIVYPGDNDEKTALSWHFFNLAEKKKVCSFFNLAEKKTYKIKNVLEDKTDHVVGTSYGWLVISNHSGKKLTLFNPFSRPHKKIELPELAGYNTFIISKAILFSEPSLTKSFRIVVSTYFPLRRLATYMHGNSNRSSKWTEFGYDEAPSYKDIICHNNMLNALYYTGSVEVWHFPNYTSSPEKVMTIHCPRSECEYIGNIGYSFHPGGETLGEVLLINVTRAFYNTPFKMENVHFHVYKLDCSGKIWEKVESLKDQVLFLSVNLETKNGLCAKSSSVYEENSIYFMCDSEFSAGKGSKKILEYGVYNLEEKIAKPFKQCNSIKGYFTPLWIVPKLW